MSVYVYINKFKQQTFTSIYSFWCSLFLLIETYFFFQPKSVTLLLAGLLEIQDVSLCYVWKCPHFIHILEAYVAGLRTWTKWVCGFLDHVANSKPVWSAGPCFELSGGTSLLVERVSRDALIVLSLSVCTIFLAYPFTESTEFSVPCIVPHHRSYDSTP